MRLRSAIVFKLLLASALASATSNGPIAIHGDSTALGSRTSGVARLWNMVPALDSERWWNKLSRSYSPHRIIFNDGVGGQPMAVMRDKMQSDKGHRQDLVIIYDRLNDDETADAYIAALSAAVATLQTNHFLILPQVSWATIKDDKLQTLQDLNRRIPAKWPRNTFSATEAAGFAKALSDPSTRSDGLHRNLKGQTIEARYIKTWIDARGW